MPKPTRKPTPVQCDREKRLSILLSDGEDEKLSDLAMGRGISRSDVVRGFIRDAMRTPGTTRLA